MSFRLPIVAFVPLLLVACAGDTRPGTSDVRMEDPWVRAMPLIRDSGNTPSNSAVYLTLLNQGSLGDRLLGGRTPAADRVEVHRSVLAGDVMRMEKLESLDLPPGSEVRLQPGGLHLMLLRLSRPLAEGDDLELTLSFERSGDLVFRVPVRGSGGG